MTTLPKPLQSILADIEARGQEPEQVNALLANKSQSLGRFVDDATDDPDPKDIDTIIKSMAEYQAVRAFAERFQSIGLEQRKTKARDMATRDHMDELQPLLRGMYEPKAKLRAANKARLARRVGDMHTRLAGESLTLEARSVLELDIAKIEAQLSDTEYLFDAAACAIESLAKSGTFEDLQNAIRLIEAIKAEA